MPLPQFVWIRRRQLTSRHTPALLVRSAQSGPWSAPATWEGGKVPAAGSRVQIRTGHAVTYDVQSDQAIRSIHVAGTLTFAPDRDTRLDVGLIKIQAGDDASEDGFDCDAHAAAPGTRAAPAGPGGRHARPADRSRPARPSSAWSTSRAWTRNRARRSSAAAGGWTFTAPPLNRTWVKLGGDRQEGRHAAHAGRAGQGWRVGDRVIVTATQRSLPRQDGVSPRSAIVKRHRRQPARRSTSRWSTSTWATASTAARWPT